MAATYSYDKVGPHVQQYGQSSSEEQFAQAPRPLSKWHPRNWSKLTWAGVILLVCAIIAGVVAGAVVGSEDAKNNSYPDYSPLNYSLSQTYSGSDFFDNFDYWDTSDPSDGFVHYLPASWAQASNWNVTVATNSSAILRVDNTETNATTGRHSARIQSKTQYNSGLFIFDVLHTPYGCATWPALWLSDPYHWPTNGEIDVMEAVNQATSGNQMTLHTTNDCQMKNIKREETGTVLETNCWNASDSNSGCGVQGPTASFGEAFNNANGGMYAMEWRTAGIRVWFFPRDDIPADIPIDVTNTSVTPDPSTWGTPLADFPSTDCDIASHFKNQSIIANIDLCGTWAGSDSVYTTEDQCPGTCENLVAQNASAFDQAYWEWQSWRVYSAS